MVCLEEKARITLAALRQATLEERLNRFLGRVSLNGKTSTAFVPNPGRLAELLYPGAEVYLQPTSSGARRRTPYDLCLVRYGKILVSIDSRVPARLVGKALKARSLAWFRDYELVKTEPRVGRGRLDFRLASPAARDCFLEVKSCTLVREGIASFPDAPTKRGSRHAEELLRLVRAGYRGAVLFVIQREDAIGFVPNAGLDPVFGESLRRAAAGGVEVCAMRCHVGLDGISLADAVPVRQAL